MANWGINDDLSLKRQTRSFYRTALLPRCITSLVSHLFEAFGDLGKPRPSFGRLEQEGPVVKRHQQAFGTRSNLFATLMRDN